MAKNGNFCCQVFKIIPGISLQWQMEAEAPRNKCSSKNGQKDREMAKNDQKLQKNPNIAININK